MPKGVYVRKISVWNKGKHMWKNRPHPRGTLGKIAWNKGLSSAITKNCEKCGTLFYYVFSRKQKYCTYKCYRSVPVSKETREKLRNACIKNGNIPPHPKGDKHPRWVNDRSLIAEKHRIRGSYAWRDWRKLVFERDRFTCQECGKMGVYLEPHHIVPVRDNMNELLFDIKNGITLCRPCHKKTMWKESNFIEKYTQKVAAHM